MVGICARAVLRRRLLGALAVALLIGIAGGAVLAAVAGARRTDSSLTRFLDHTGEPDETIFPLDFRDFDKIDSASVGRLPGVEQVGSGLGYLLGVRTEHAGLIVADNADALAAENAAFAELGRAGRLEGRIPRNDRSNEVFVNDVVARDYGLKLGSVFPASIARFSDLLAAPPDVTPEQFEALFKAVDLRVVGIGRVVDQFLANENQERGVIVLGPAFAREFRSYATFRVIGVKLRDPNDLSKFESALRARYADVPLQLTSRPTKEATYGRVVQPYVDALRLFGIVAALTGLLVTAQALIRLVAADATDGSTLDALGATRPQRASVSAARALFTIAAGTVLAVLFAIAASALFPVGPSRDAELHEGLRIDAVVLGVGVLVMVFLLTTAVGWTAWRRAGLSGRLGARADERRRRPSALVNRLGQSGAPVSAVAGVRFAIERDRAHGAVPLTTTLFGLVIAIMTIGAALTFRTNLDRLVTSPERYGWNWDTLIDAGDEGADDELLSEVRSDKSLSAVTVGTRAVVPIGGHTLPAYGLQRMRGHATLAVLDGRLPAAADEVALGRQSLQVLGGNIGDTVVARAADGAETRLRIVGQTVFPSLSLNATYGIGEGAALTADGLRAIEPNVGPSFFMVDLTEGTDLGSVREHYGEELGVDGVQRPGDISSYSRIRATPIALAGLLAVLGVGVLVHLLVTSIRNRRRDLAVMKTLGCTRRQLALAVAWQATTLVTAALLAGVPMGVVAGRLTWRAFAHDLGIGTGVAVPAAAFIGIAVTSVIVANLIALLPRAAAHTPAGAVLTVRDD